MGQLVFESSVLWATTPWSTDDVIQAVLPSRFLEDSFFQTPVTRESQGHVVRTYVRAVDYRTTQIPISIWVSGSGLK